MGFWRELRRRHIFRIAAIYVATGWLVLQLGAIVFPALHVPSWALSLLIGFVALGFPVALVLAWAYEVTPDGVRRTEAAESNQVRALETRQRIGHILNIAIIVILAAAVGVLAWRLSSRGGSTSVQNAAGAGRVVTTATAAVAAPVTAIPAKSVAVLPFENLSADKSNGYFAAGMQDMILTKLADIGDLKVMSRTSTAKYQSHPDDLGAIARQLRVATFLEGSVQKAGDQVLINVQLIDARTGAHIWAQAYKRTLNDIFGVEGEVAQEIAAALDSKLSPAEKRAVANVPTRNPEAYDAYLRAKHYNNQASDQSAYSTLLPKAIADYQRAVKLDPNFALAWAGLAATQIEILQTGNVKAHAKAVVRDAETNARRALKLAPKLPEAHLALALVYRYGHHDSWKMRGQLEQALKLRPSYAKALWLLAEYEANFRGDFDEAYKDLQRAFEIDPNNSLNALALGAARCAMRDYDGAREMLRRAIALAPNNANAYQLLSLTILNQTGDIAAALKVLDTIPADAPRKSDLDDWRVQLLVMQKNFAAARRVAAGLHMRMSPGRVLDVFLRGYVEWAAGDRAKARPYLRKADEMLRARIAKTPENTDLYQYRARALAMLGDRSEALQLIHKAIHIDTMGGHPSNEYIWLLRALARIEVIAGDQKGAIDTLRKLITTPLGGLFISPAALKVNPIWDPLRKDPRFQALLKQFPTTPVETTVP